ncbi:MAG: aminopeptidase [Promethearchaeota archaeon]
MLSDYNEKLAKLVVNYAVDVKPGDKVVLAGAVDAIDLFQAIYAEVIKAGAHILEKDLAIPGNGEIFFKHATEEQLKFVNPLSTQASEILDKYISIFSSTNRKGLANIDQEKMMMVQKANSHLQQKLMERTAKGEVMWNLCPYPSPAFAQEGNMGTLEYKEFVYKALALDKPDPVAYWKEVEKKHESVIAILEKGKTYRVVGEDTDISMNIEGRKWMNSCGHRNLPDGEVHSSPHEDSVNGTIRFTYPGIRSGKEIENIWLKFKDGKVVEHDASKGKEYLDKVLELENADRLGEIAVGTNYGITKFTKNMLFDEKMGGTIHFALGSGYPQTGSKNVSNIHWDILKDMKSDESVIYVDGKEIYRAGKWLIS